MPGIRSPESNSLVAGLVLAPSQPEAPRQPKPTSTRCASWLIRSATLASTEPSARRTNHGGGLALPLLPGDLTPATRLCKSTGPSCAPFARRPSLRPDAVSAYSTGGGRSPMGVECLHPCRNLATKTQSNSCKARWTCSFWKRCSGAHATDTASRRPSGRIRATCSRWTQARYTRHFTGSNARSRSRRRGRPLTRTSG